MHDPIVLTDALVRGAAAGASTLIAIVLLYGSNGARARRLAAAFLFATACYVIISNTRISAAFGGVVAPMGLLAVLGPVFFWWFAASIFDDAFRWTWWRLAPAFVMLAVFAPRLFELPAAVETARWYSHIGLNVLLFGDVIRLAVSNVGDDLVDPRRRFRAIVGTAVPVVGLSIATAETLHRNGWSPGYLLQVQALVILGMNLGFGAWFLTARRDLLIDEAEAVRRRKAGTNVSDGPPPADRADYDRLMALMSEGAYRREGLTIGALAELVGVPEHQLRRLINRELGYKNFSSFLNARRVDDAKTVLSDPSQARRQITQIALDLGYGSIAPFNRAFKEATGMTPTAYRKAAINGGTVGDAADPD
ncbi:MAG: AraC family transcriptional regulator [Pseudomonadota bacterium]